MRYSNSIINKNKYYKYKIYPNIPLYDSDEYIITTISDRLDIIAYKYYGDSSLWWVILITNPELRRDSMFPPKGTQLRICTEINKIMELFDELNNL